MITILDYQATTMDIIIAGLTAISLLVGYLISVIYKANDR